MPCSVPDNVPRKPNVVDGSLVQQFCTVLSSEVVQVNMPWKSKKKDETGVLTVPASCLRKSFFPGSVSGSASLDEVASALSIIIGHTAGSPNEVSLAPVSS